jgi:hypothetical protein
MGKRLNVVCLLILSILLSCGTGCTDTGSFAASGKAGTLGLGGELTTAVTSNINARVGGNTLDLDIGKKEIDDVEYDIGLDFSSFSALADWHAFNDSFRISGGVLALNHKFNLDARPTTDQKIGDNTYTSDEIGTISGCVTINDIAPYVGIGWGNPFTESNRWGFTCDVGVAFTNSPDVTLTSTGSVPAEELEKERKDIEDDLDEYKYYPVIAISFFYRF